MNSPIIPEEARAELRGFLHGLALDAVIFGFHDCSLKVLLLEYKNTLTFALPGGFIREKEDLTENTGFS